jgi:hypothetical protein
VAVVALFAGLLIAFGVGLWGTLLRPAAHELRGTIVARPAPDTILVRHDAHQGLGMQAMDVMAVTGDPARLEAAAVRPGDRVRLGVRAEGDRLLLLRIEKVP